MASRVNVVVKALAAEWFFVPALYQDGATINGGFSAEAL
jgi:hypothetical protein